MTLLLNRNIVRLKTCLLKKRNFQKTGFFLIFILTVFINCNTNRGVIKYLHLEDSGKNITFQNTNLGKIKPDIYNDNSLISLLDGRNGIIYIYNHIQNQFTDSIDIKYRKKQFLFDYNILDKNRVLLSVIPTYFGDQHDSVVCIIDRNKNVLKTFSFRNTPAPMYDANSPYAYRKTSWWYSIHSNFPVRINEKDSTVLAVLAPYYNQTCDSIANNTMEFAYKISSKSNAPATPLGFTIPECSRYYNKNSKINKAPYGDYNKDNKAVFGYEHSSKLMTDDAIFEPHLQLYEMLDKHTFLYYKRLVYDKHRNCFWWVIEVDYDDGNSEKQLKNYADYYLVSLNENLEITSEGFMPKYSGLHVVPLEEGLLVKNNKKSDSLGINDHSLFVPTFQDWKLENIKTQLFERTQKSNQNLEQFVELLKNGSSENKFLLLSLDRMPPNYASILLDKLSENKENFSTNAICIFTNDENKIPENLKTKIKIYRYGVLKEYVNDFSSPVILEVSEDKEIQLTEYPTNEAQILIGKIINW